MNKENGKAITLDVARKYINNYRDHYEILPVVKTESMLINRECIDKILLQKDCSYLRFFMAKASNNETGQYTLVIVGVDNDGNNIIQDGENAQIYQELTLCPPDCNGGNIL